MLETYLTFTESFMTIAQMKKLWKCLMFLLYKQVAINIMAIKES